MGVLLFLFFTFVSVLFIRSTQERVITGNNFVRKPSSRLKAPKIVRRVTSPLQTSRVNVVDILERNFPYYTALSEADRSVFVHRLDTFIRTHKFVPADMDAVTSEMQVMISACAIQITFGLNDFVANHIQGFKVYPTVYYSRLMDGHLRGH